MPSDGPTEDALERTRRNAVHRLLAERTEVGHWAGELSSSALSTATAVTALAAVDHAEGATTHQTLVDGGLRWLADHQNPDGGWGDTVRSLSNISTTVLGWAAFAAGVGPEARPSAVERAEHWLQRHAGSLHAEALAETILRRYGKDRTFSVPILTMAAIAGRLGEDPQAWRLVKQLPFELAAFPRSGFRFLRLPVVSYALPALIAIGHARHAKRPTRNPLARAVRAATHARTLDVLDQIQPPNGGFLEATPLTSFVAMSLTAAGLHGHAVVRRGVGFLRRSVRPDGSWPIDTNLATWVTTLSTNALAAGGRIGDHLGSADRGAIAEWLVGQQYRQVHPYTNAPPGGWAWTHLPGGVPDADDTSGAVVALSNLGVEGAGEPTREAVRWLLDLQNGDGGIPTFCRGWGKLPFDRSSADITGHAIRAVEVADGVPAGHRGRERALRFLRRAQRPDGSWVPLWFGNQHGGEEENPCYGTARVLLALAGSDSDAARRMRCRGLAWLVRAQHASGGWGGDRRLPPSIEETALAVEAIASARRHEGQAAELSKAWGKGLRWLVDQTDGGRTFEPSPIGFYFARLWYFERLYPLIFTVGALERSRPAR